MVVRISRNAASACTERGEALKIATGLSTNGGKLTSQSSAFLSTAVTPCAYSGLAISTASARSSSTCSALTGDGMEASRSGLNKGSAAMPAKIRNAHSGGETREQARSSARFVDAARRLPHSARTFIRHVSLARRAA